MPERAGELLGRLVVGAQLGRALAGRRSVAHHGLHVAGRVGVMRQPRRVDRAARGSRRERRQHGAVKLDPPVRGDRLLDRQAGQLVAELEHATVVPEHPRGQTFLEGAEIRLGDRLEQPQLDPRRHHRRGLEQPARRRLEVGGAGQDGVAHALGQLARRPRPGPR